MNIGPAQILILVLVVLLLFGARKLPELARSVGRSMRIFKSEVQEMKEESASAAAPQQEQENEEDFWDAPENQPRQITRQQPQAPQPGQVEPPQNSQQPNQQNQ